MKDGWHRPYTFSTDVNYAHINRNTAPICVCVCVCVLTSVEKVYIYVCVIYLNQ